MLLRGLQPLLMLHLSLRAFLVSLLATAERFADDTLRRCIITFTAVILTVKTSSDSGRFLCLIEQSSVIDRTFGYLSPGSSSLVVFAQSAGFTLSCVRSRRRCLRVRQSRSASAELTPSSQCDALVCQGLALSRNRSRADPLILLRTLSHVRMVWESPASIVVWSPLTLSERCARLFWFFVVLCGLLADQH